MAKIISISEESVQDLLKKSNDMIEELRSNVHSIERSLNMAESMGWNDQKFIEVKDDYRDILSKINESLIATEEIMVPKLRKILNNIEDF